MFGGKKYEETSEFEDKPAPKPTARVDGDTKTQIGPGTTIKGDVSVEGDAIIHGSVEGNLVASGQVEVMKTGVVKADVRGKSVRVIGRVEGKIMSQDRVQLLSGAHVRGDIHSQSLKIDEGVYFQGACVMGENAFEASAPKVLPMPANAGSALARAANG